MSNAARVHTVEQGHETSNRTLIGFGGAAPLHISRVAEKLRVKTFVCFIWVRENILKIWIRDTKLMKQIS